MGPEVICAKNVKKVIDKGQLVDQTIANLDDHLHRAKRAIRDAHESQEAHARSCTQLVDNERGARESE